MLFYVFSEQMPLSKNIARDHLYVESTSSILFASFNAKQIGLVKTASLARVPKKIKRKIEDENVLMSLM